MTSKVLGKRVHSICIIPDIVFEKSGDEILADEVLIDLGDDILSIVPLVDTDEISVRFLEGMKMSSYDNIEVILEQYTNRKLSCTWNAVNSNGYTDIFIIAFDNLAPSLLVLSENSVLKIIQIKEESGVHPQEPDNQ